MKLIFSVFAIFINLLELKAQEKVNLLSNEDRKKISKLFDQKNYELISIKKIDSSNNKKIISNYNGFYFNQKEIYFYDKNNNLELVTEYELSPENKKQLIKRMEKKIEYSKNFEKIDIRVWNENNEIRNEIIEKLFDDHHRPLQIITKSYNENLNDTLTIKEIYTYTINKLQNSETICVKEFSKTRTPETFESCDSYLIENDKNSKKRLDNVYIYDDKKRLIKEVIFDKNKNPYFENLYLYNDKKNSMIFERYRYKKLKTLVAKKLVEFNEIGLTQKETIYGLSDDNILIPETKYLYFYDKDNSLVMELELKSKKFIGIPPTPPF